MASDEREGGRRALLNYGHTLAHALEIATEHRLTHGEAVGIGLVYAAELARAPRPHRRGARRASTGPWSVGTYGLPTTVPAGLVADDLVTLMGRDKKALTGGLTFVLDGPAGVEVVPDVPEAAVRAALDDAAAVIPDRRAPNGCCCGGGPTTIVRRGRRCTPTRASWRRSARSWTGRR